MFMFIPNHQFRICISPTFDTLQFASPVHVSLARISHQLCSISFYCNCRKFYYYDCSMSVKNRSYEVCICWLRKRTHAHTARNNKSTQKQNRSSMRVKGRGKEKVEGAMSYAIRLNANVPPAASPPRLYKSVPKHDKSEKKYKSWERQMLQCGMAWYGHGCMNLNPSPSSCLLAQQRLLLLLPQRQRYILFFTSSHRALGRARPSGTTKRHHRVRALCFTSLGPGPHKRRRRGISG